MENPRKNPNRNDSKRRNGQVVDLRTYQNRRRKTQMAKRSSAFFDMDNHLLMHLLCYAVLTATVVFSILGMIAFSWRTHAQIIGVFLATVGLVCGLWLNSLRDRKASRILLFQAGAFVFAYLCALLHFVI